MRSMRPTPSRVRGTMPKFDANGGPNALASVSCHWPLASPTITPTEAPRVHPRATRALTQPPPSRTTPLVNPPVALAIDVFARILAEVGRADDEDLEAFWPSLVASPRAGRDAHRVPFFELDDLVVDFHPSAPAQDHVHLLLLHVRVAVRKAIAGRDVLVAQCGPLELERLGRRAELQVRRAVEPMTDVLQILLDVAARERHQGVSSFQWPSVTTSTLPSTTLIAV